MKQVLIITSSIGNGHMTAAKNTETMLNKLYGSRINCHVIDIVEYLSKTLNITSRSLYNASLKISPNLYKMCFEASDKPVNMKAMNIIQFPLLKKNTQKLIESIKPNIIVSTYPILDYPVRKIAKDTEFISIITDSSTIHYSWIASNADYFIVTDDDSKEVLIEKNIPKEKIFDFGFPVNQDFYKPIDRINFAKTHELKNDKFSLLIICHQRRTHHIVELAKRLSEYGENIQIIIITGKNKRIYKSLQKIKLNNVKILPWISNMDELMQFSDLIITKAGGATVQECIAAQKPMIIFDNYPGQEEGNVRFIKKKNIGLIMTDNSPLETTAKVLMLSCPNNGTYAELQNNLKSIHKYGSTEKIGRFIGKHIGLE